MSRATRRGLLAGTVGLAAAFAGCSGLAGSSGESETVTEGRIGNGENSTTDPETLQIRRDTDRPPVWLDNGDGERPPVREEQRHFESLVIDSPSRADRIEVADGTTRDRIDDFLGATDFDTETMYIETIRVEECFRLELCGVAWQPGRVSTDYTRLNRPYTERCAVDTHVFEVLFIRIPAALDADRVTSHSTSIGTGSCQAGPQAEANGAGGSGSGGGE